MRRGVDFAKSVFHVGSRAAERILPPALLYFLLWPLTVAIAARSARQSPDWVPLAAVPALPGSKRPSAWQRWRYFSRLQSHWWLLGWLDRLAQPKWQRRFDVRGLEHLTSALAARPVIVATVHTTSLVVLASWIRSLGIPTGAVPIDATWFTSAARQRKVALAERFGRAVTFRSDSAREMIEFLRPGNALVLTVDHMAGRTTLVPWGTGSIAVSTGIVRMAHAAGAAVVPVVMFNTGRWRYQAIVGEAVPQELIAAGATSLVADYLVARLVPEVVARPDQAMPMFTASFS